MVYFEGTGCASPFWPAFICHVFIFMSSQILIPFFAGCLIFLSPAATAQETRPNHPSMIRPATDAVTESELSLARDFVSRISAGFARADKILAAGNTATARKTGNILPEGEMLLFRVRLERGLMLDAPLTGRVQGGDIVLSLRDFVAALEFPITFTADGMSATGWYIRENKIFTLDTKAREIRTDQGVFHLPQDVRIEDGDIFIASDMLAQWFGFSLRPEPGSLELYLKTPVPLPIQERMARQGRDYKTARTGPPVLPRAHDDPGPVAVPFVDVATRTTLDRPGEGKNRHQSSASVRTAGDLAYGTLTTQSQIDNENRLSSFRANYRQDSLVPELLGPLRARRFEIGDLSTVRMALQNGSLEQGVRVTNVHPQRSYLRPSTSITGTAFPGWDVELYRENQFLGMATVGDDGTYSFDQISLFSSDNTFRVVMYGPQGEVREENLYIPVDTKHLSDIGSAYDISLSRQNTQTYRKNARDNEDTGAPHLSALYEHPLGEGSIGLIGTDIRQRDGEHVGTLHAGISTTLAQTLVNINTALDNSGEMAAEIVARRKIRQHEIRNEIELATDRYDIGAQQKSREIFTERLDITGPFPLFTAMRPRYNTSLKYTVDSDGDSSTDATAGLNASWNRMALGQQFHYNVGSSNTDGQLRGTTTLSGNAGLNRLRLVTEYDIAPAHHLTRVIASGQRYLDTNLEAGIDLAHQLAPRLSEAGFYLNWDAGFARLSPEMRYNSDNDLTAILSTRFGITHDPQQKQFQMSDRPVSTYGGLSAFVFLDRDGDLAFGPGDEPLPDIVVQAPQNSGHIVTGKDGYASFTRMNNLRLTDVFIDTESLPDPLWISAFPGQSILPREGHMHEMRFPVHISGEIDGTVYAQNDAGQNRPIRGIRLHLLSPDGQKKMSVVSEQDGFFLFTRIPPGRYYLTVDNSGLDERHMAGPAAQPVDIGYEGTTLYSQNIYLKENSRNIAFEIIADSGTNAQTGTRALNLGRYKSQMAMGLAWFHLKTRYASLLHDATLVEKPSDSLAAAQTGMHTLRVLLPGGDLQDAYRRCRILVENNLACGVEILPAPPREQRAVAAQKTNG